MKIVVIMDNIAHVKVAKDTTIGLMIEAHKRGHTLFTSTPNTLMVKDGKVLATVYATTVFDNPQKWHEREDPITTSLEEFDLVLMRQDPPFNLNYLFITYLLELVYKNGVPVINNPRSVRDANEKLFSLNFPSCIPPTLVSANQTSIENFCAYHREIVIKPLNNMGGNGIFKLSGKSKDRTHINKITNQQTTPIIAQKFLPDITSGDKRIILIDGEPIPFALARIPRKGSFKGNLAQGATGVAQPLSKRDYELCQTISPTLKEMDLFFVGLDVIGDYITEINSTSPTGIRELNAQCDLNIAASFFNKLEQKLNLK